MEHFVGFILAIIPFYYVLKLAFVLWLWYPENDGATIVYDSYLREMSRPLDAHLASLEGAASNVQQKLTEDARAAKARFAEVTGITKKAHE